MAEGELRKLEHLRQRREDPRQRAGAQRPEPFPQAFAIHSPQLIECDTSLLAREATRGRNGYACPAVVIGATIAVRN
jgi:hypothetical protein